MKKVFLLIGLILIQYGAISQNIGMGTTTPNPNAMLDIKSNDKGILVPRLTSPEATLLTGSLSNVEKGLLIYNLDSNCFAYWHGATWILFPKATSGVDTDDQMLTLSNDTLFIQDGNFVKLPAGTVDTDDQMLTLSNDTLFIQDGNFVKLPAGTVDTDDQILTLSNDTLFIQDGNFVKLPAGTVDTDDQMLTLSNDTLFIQDGNFVKLPAGTVDTDDQMLTLSNDTLFIQDGNFVKLPANNAWNLNGNAGTNSGVNFIGTSDAEHLILKTNNTEALRITDMGIVSINNNTPANPTYKLQVYNEESSILSYSIEGTALFGLSDSSYGVVGKTSGYPFTAAGVYGVNYHPAGTGVVGGGNALAIGYTFILPQGSGGAFTGEEIGVYGKATNTTSNYTFGGFFENNGSQTLIGGWDNFSSIDYKVLGSGAVSTIVKNENDQNVVMFAPESPEIVFEDYGISTLVNGKATITFDPILAKNIKIDEEHPLKVFIQEEGESNGVYITNKSVNGFDVIEKNNGTSAISFSWRIVASRKNKTIIDDKGNTRETKYENARFPLAPSYQKSIPQSLPHH